MKNQEGQNSLELATAEDVKCLLQDSMLAAQQNNVQSSNQNTSGSSSPSPVNKTETVTLPTGASMALPVPIPQVNNIFPFSFIKLLS